MIEIKTATGAVIKVYPKYVSIKTVNGEYLNLCIKNYTPNVGDIYTGTIYSANKRVLIKIIILCIFISLVLFGKSLYNFIVPSTTIVVNIPPTIQFKVNNQNTIKTIKGINSSGKKLSDSLKIRNKSLVDGLKAIIEQAKSLNYIDKNFTQNNNMITIFISNNKDIDFSKFDQFMKNEKLKYRLNVNGKAIFSH